MSERVLHEWRFAGYVCRIVETEPGIVHFEQAQGPPIGQEQIGPLAFNRTEKPMGDANEIIQLSLALRDVEAERDRLKVELGEAEDGIWVLLVAYSPEGHDAPRECFATGPLTGDPISDLVLCPACAAEKHSAVRRARERGK